MKTKVYQRLNSDLCDPKHIISSTLKFLVLNGLWAFGYTCTGVGGLEFLPHNQTMNKECYLEMLCNESSDCFKKTGCNIFRTVGLVPKNSNFNSLISSVNPLGFFFNKFAVLTYKR